MTPLRRNLLFCAIGLAIVAAITWWWFDTMEKRWTALPNFSDAVRENPMLATTRLLKRHGHEVDIESTLGEALLRQIPNGTIIVGENGGTITKDQTEQLLAWVRNGNTLVAQPKWSNRTRHDACDAQGNESKPADKPFPRNLADADPLGSRFGVELVAMRRNQPKKDDDGDDDEDDDPPENSKTKKPPPCMAHFTPPGKDYPLELDAEYAALDSKEPASTPVLMDKDGVGARIYTEGKGHVAFVANDYFDNYSLGLNDHAEFLLYLASLNPGAKHVLLVQRLDVLSWYVALWSYFKYGIVSLGVGLMLLLWIAIRRFGPVLPEPNVERRSLIEHVDASGRWLWQLAGGRASLLEAARNVVNKTLHRRVPDLLGMAPAEKLNRLARDTGLSHEAIDAALNQPASKMPSDFTRQIQTLQQLGKHYER